MNTRSHATTSASVTTSVASTMDRDIDAMLCKFQSRNFSGEGKQVGKQLEEWIEKTEDYFDLAQPTAKSKEMITRFKLEKSAKLWWKDHCTKNSVDAQTTTWAYIKDKLKLNYQKNTYMVQRINEFLDSSERNKDLEGYYQHFFTLLKYAPQGMTQEIKVARFIIGLNYPMKNRMQALCLKNFAKVLEAGKPLE